MSIKNNKGITLIALVITIIVLLILAGVTISMVLGDDGIIAEAQDAKIAQQKAEEKQAIKLAVGEAGTSEHLNETVTKAEYEAAFPEGDYDKAQIREILEVEKSKTDATKVNIPIPKGMAYAIGEKLDDGIVVVDKYGNEYVWVPVSDTTSWTEPGVEPSDGQGTTDSINTDFALMKASVDIYKGFYVGRYETSYNGTRVASVGNVTPLYQTQVIDENVTTTWYTFYTKQKELYSKESDSVVSGMIYVGQWNAIMKWMENVPNDDPSITYSTKKFYTKNSIGMGWYSDNYESGNPTHITGKDLNGGKNKVFNIYDLAGNYYEWTQKASASINRVARGGYYYGLGSNHPASGSSNYDPDTALHTHYSSRLQLYIK